ncbi:GNAT family N-acetyltransferase [Olivibacter sitiensis]|uniref:GNAT family N-acetyltransferase n=1 Tax=Olivibacter sitiensis TaxID=376470 RepID=UPI001FE1DD6F|nr:GNAT family N-acetyltransferase [Olivibacter sitiensis]
MQSIDDFRDYVRISKLLYQQEKEISFVIILNEITVGRIGLHHLNSKNKSASIGYWLAKDAEGKGIVTKSCKLIIAFGFQQLDLERIEVKVAVNNLKSEAIPRRLNFKLEGILRRAELVTINSSI